MAMRSIVGAFPCSGSALDVARPLIKAGENTHRAGKCEAVPGNLSMTLASLSLISPVEAPSTDPEPYTFYQTAELLTASEGTSDSGSCRDDDSTSTYDDEDSYEAGSDYSEDIDCEDDADLDSSSSPVLSKVHQIRSWSLDRAAVEAMYRKRVNEVVEQTFLSAEHSGMLLRSFRWNTEAAVEAWYSSEGQMNRWLGLDDGTVVSAEVPAGPVLCGICFEESSQTSAAACEKHRFCNSCWTGYIDVAISSGVGKDSLCLCCPKQCTEPDECGDKRCPGAVSDSMIMAHASPAMRNLFVKLRLQSLVQSDRSLRCCPAPDCSFVVQVEAGAAACTGALEVTCMSGHSFCWSCGEQPHAPVDCELANMWNKLCSQQGEEISLILESLKECPKCHVPIEKVGGCSHVECLCQHKFCWDCLESLDKHSDEDCQAPRGEGPELLQLRNKADMVSTEEHSFGRYYLAWLECQEQEKLATATLEDIQSRPSEWFVSSETASFLKDSWRKLKWMQVGNYYAEADTLTVQMHKDKQVEAKSALERLHAVVTCSTTAGKAASLSECEAAARTLFLGL